MHVQLTQGIDVALLTFWAFVLFFVGLVFYLRREDRREGYPVEDNITGDPAAPGGFLSTAPTKFFRLSFDRGIVSAPTRGREPVDIAARRLDRNPGSPLVPTGNPLIDGIGPAAWTERAKAPDLDWEGHPRIVPLSVLQDFWVTRRDIELRGLPMYGLDHRPVGVIEELWVDRAERLIRYLQVALDGGGSVLVPMAMAVVQRGKRRVVVDALPAADFAAAPRIAAPATITFYEEERVQAYFGGGYLYGSRDRQEPFL